MFDVTCRNCGEPWENDTLHEVAGELGATYSHMARLFSAKGCGAFIGSSYEVRPCKSDTKATARGMLAELLGEDMDGYASMIDDAEYMGLI
jgi:hypothetical protein